MMRHVVHAHIFAIARARLGDRSASVLFHDALRRGGLLKERLARATGMEVSAQSGIDREPMLLTLRCRVPEAGSNHWWGDMLVIDQDIPETAANAAIGKPIGATIRGAGANDLIVEECRVREGRTYFMTRAPRLSHEDIPLGWADRLAGPARRTVHLLTEAWRREFLETHDPRCTRHPEIRDIPLMLPVPILLTTAAIFAATTLQRQLLGTAPFTTLAVIALATPYLAGSYVELALGLRRIFTNEKTKETL